MYAADAPQSPEAQPWRSSGCGVARVPSGRGLARPGGVAAAGLRLVAPQLVGAGRRATDKFDTGRPTADDTATHVFAAFDWSGAPTAGVVAHRSGSCFASRSRSRRVRLPLLCRPTRCFDPCFVVPHVEPPASSATPTRGAGHPAAVDRSCRRRRRAAEVSPAVGDRARRRQALRGDHRDGARSCGTSPLATSAAADWPAWSARAHARQLHALYRSIDGVVRSVQVTVAWQAG